jgi:hypothetical protein
MKMALGISALDVILSGFFTVLVAGQWLKRRKFHQLLWSIALLVWTIAVGAETIAAYRDTWDPLTYRFYYAFGALLVAPWLGAGSLYLAASERIAKTYFTFVLLLTIVGGLMIFTFAIDPALLSQTDTLGFVEVKIFPFIPVRILIVIGNITGTLAFVGSALSSVYRFRSKNVARDRMLGVLLIAAGGLVAATAHSIGALGGVGMFRVSELLALAFIFSGYLLSTAPSAQPVATLSTGEV